MGMPNKRFQAIKVHYEFQEYIQYIFLAKKTNKTNLSLKETGNLVIKHIIK
jgi:hypothetical protein